MKLNHSAAYALHALAYLAARDPKALVPSHVVARAAGVPERYLLKLLSPLVGAGVLRSLKGPHGGYALARGLRAVTLLDVIEAVDGPVRGTAPELDAEESAPIDRRLAEVCEGAAELARKALAKVRLADLVSGSHAG